MNPNGKWDSIRRVFRTPPRLTDFSENDADARRIRSDLAALRARFPDHA